MPSGKGINFDIMSSPKNCLSNCLPEGTCWHLPGRQVLLEQPPDLILLIEGFEKIFVLHLVHTMSLQWNPLMINANLEGKLCTLILKDELWTLLWTEKSVTYVKHTM